MKLFRENIEKRCAYCARAAAVSDEQVATLASLFNVPKLSINENGYLNNLTLRFPDECGRHKLLDLIGDLYLAGGWINAKIEAFKPGHRINTQMAKAIRKTIY